MPDGAKIAVPNDATNEARALIEQATEEVVGATSRDYANPVLAGAFQEYGYGATLVTIV